MPSYSIILLLVLYVCMLYSDVCPPSPIQPIILFYFNIVYNIF